ncbi:MAG: serine/threonine-protein kinase [Phycisphaerales bacterium]
MKFTSDQLLDQAGEIGAKDVPEDFAAFVRARGITDDSILAEVIEADARSLLSRGREVELDRYLEAVPNLPEMPVSLDAAIEFTLRSWTLRSGSGGDAVSELVGRYPSLSRSIRNSAALSDGLMCTQETERAFREDRGETLGLPRGFGPPLRDGVLRYELRRALGEGSQGAVYLAVDRAMSDAGNEALVAVKVLEGRVSSEGERWRRMDEATKARRVTHENVVRVLDRGWCDEREYIVYEYIRGGDLDAWLAARGRLTARQAADIVRRLALGVHAAHMAGLVHRDLKPGNVLMDEDACTGRVEPKITDFGVADRAGPRVVEGGEGCGREGNIAFIAPEQYRCEEGASCVPVDVYALGGLLYYLLTGRLPNGSSAAEIRRRHSEGRGRGGAPELISPAEGTDRTLRDICRRALAPEIGARHRSADALASDLDRWLRDEPIPWQRPGPARRLRLLSRRQPRAVALCALTLAVAGVGAGATMWTWAYASAWASAERAARARASEYFEAASHAATRGRASEITENWFPALNALESIAGPYVFDPRKVGAEGKNAKLRLAAAAIRSAQSSGQADSLEALLWSDTLAFWLLRSGDYERAEALLNRTEQSWDAKLSADDPWRINRAAMKAAARAQRAMWRVSEGERFSADDPEIQRVVRTLREAERHYAAERFGDVMHRFVLGCLVQLYDERGLNDSASRRWAEQQVERVRLEFRQGGPSTGGGVGEDYTSTAP